MHRLLTPVLDPSSPGLYTPDDVMDGARISGPAVIYDDDGGYLAAALAEKLLAGWVEVNVVTPHATFARWTRLTLEQARLTRQMLEQGIELKVATQLRGFGREGVRCEYVYTGREVRFDAVSLVMVTSRTPDDRLYEDLQARLEALARAGIGRVDRIGDCEAPGLIADAVFAGHRLARHFDRPEEPDLS